MHKNVLISFNYRASILAEDARLHKEFVENEKQLTSKLKRVRLHIFVVVVTVF